MEFTVIDFETANSNRSSACSLGIVKFKDGDIINEYSYLINPEEKFNNFNISIHGITADMVKDKPNFPKIWTEIKAILDNSSIIIAHNASFDISVLKHALDKYSLEYPEFIYSCTRILAKKTWTSLINYKLDTIAKHLKIEFKHHDATEDAKATAKILNEIIKENNAVDMTDLHSKLGVDPGHIFSGGHNPARAKSCYKSISNIKPTVNEVNEDSNFYNKTVVFTGTLCIPRKEAMQKVINSGGYCANNVTKSTNYLVIGELDYSKFADGMKSSKMKKAEDLICKGQDLEIISEDEFLRML